MLQERVFEKQSMTSIISEFLKSPHRSKCGGIIVAIRRNYQLSPVSKCSFETCRLFTFVMCLSDFTRQSKGNPCKTYPDEFYYLLTNILFILCFIPQTLTECQPYTKARCFGPWMTGVAGQARPGLPWGRVTI